MNQDVPVPDAGNYDFGDKPIPDNFLDETLNRALGEHKRKESQIQSLEDDFAEMLDANVASNIAANLIGYIHTDDDTQNDNNNSSNNNKPRDPDEDDVRVGNDDEDNNNNATQYGLDEMLIETVTAHKHRESRTDFVTQKLHEMFPQDPDDGDVMDPYGQITAGGDDGSSNTFGGGKIDMSQIASNLVAFLHDDHGSKPQTPQYPPDEEISLETEVKPKAKRGSTNLSVLQQQIEQLQDKVNNLESQLNNKEHKNKELNNRVNELENKNHDLMNEIRLLQNSKTTLAINSTKCIDELREILIQYQKQLNLTSD